MTNIIIYSNNIKLINRIKNTISRNFKNINTLIFSEMSLDLQAIITSKNKIIYIICIDKEDPTCIKLAEDIRKNDFQSILIFVISYELSAIYLSKKKFMFLTLISIYNNFEHELLESINIALYILKRKNIVTLSTTTDIYFINTKEVLYINSSNNKTYIHLLNKVIETTLSLKELIVMLKCHFIQTHKSCYINIENIYKIDFQNNLIVFTNSSKINLLSRRYRNELKNNLSIYTDKI